MTTQPEQKSKSISLLCILLVIASAYLARDVLMPIAVAILFAFLLASLTKGLERMRLGRTASAVVAVLAGIGVVSLLAWCLLVQFGKFGNEFTGFPQETG